MHPFAMSDSLRYPSRLQKGYVDLEEVFILTTF